MEKQTKNFEVFLTSAYKAITGHKWKGKASNEALTPAQQVAFVEKAKELSEVIPAGKTIRWSDWPMQGGYPTNHEYITRFESEFINEKNLFILHAYLDERMEVNKYGKGAIYRDFLRYNDNIVKIQSGMFYSN